jgi:hypothetical protein
MLRKIKLVLEVEVDESPNITADVLQRTWGHLTNHNELLEHPEIAAGLKYEKELLAALRAQPELFTEFLTIRLLSQLEGLTTQETHDLAGRTGQRYPRPSPEEKPVYDQLMPLLSAAARKHFKEAEGNGTLSEATDLVYDSFTFKPLQVRIEGNLLPGAESE